jgi:hypothetical protein
MNECVIAVDTYESDENRTEPTILYAQPSSLIQYQCITSIVINRAQYKHLTDCLSGTWRWPPWIKMYLLFYVRLVSFHLEISFIL